MLEKYVIRVELTLCKVEVDGIPFAIFEAARCHKARKRYLCRRQLIVPDGHRPRANGRGMLITIPGRGAYLISRFGIRAIPETLS